MILISTYPCPDGFKNIEIDLRNINELGKGFEYHPMAFSIRFIMASKMLIVWRFLNEKDRDEQYMQIKKLMREMPEQSKKCAWCGNKLTKK